LLSIWSLLVVALEAIYQAVSVEGVVLVDCLRDFLV
jgi:hypothetical protein